MLALVGCGEAAQVEDGESAPQKFPYQTERQGIKNGTVDSNSTAVVGLGIRRGRGFATCTGTLIAKNLVLTAQHCVSQLSQRRIDCDQTEFTGTFSKDSIRVTTETRIRSARNFHTVEKIVTPDATGVCGNDIALLQLRSNVLSSEADPRAPQLEQEIQRQDGYTAIGYGTTGQNESGKSGVRRRREGREVKCVGTNCFGGYVKSGEFRGSGGTCQGDSGGGAYKPDGRVFGILSRGGGDCATSLYTSVTNWKGFLRTNVQQAAKDGNYSPPAWATPSEDPDEDGIGSNFDNCPMTANSEQKNMDAEEEPVDDKTGDACDSDIDGDGYSNEEDNCPKTKNPQQFDLDGDGEGNACDRDADGDDIPNKSDLCPTMYNPSQEPSGESGDCKDSDGDGIADSDDNCPQTTNPEQQDKDDDGKGAVCDPDEEKESDDNSGDDDDSSDSEPEPQPVPEKVDDSGCSTGSNGGPVGPIGFGLFVLLLGARRIEFRSN